jgi:hypothetical protein
MRWTLAIVSDLHAGSTVGLHPNSGTTLDDGGVYNPNKPQRWLWERWLDYWSQVSESRADKLAVLVNGDVVDGSHHETTQLVSGNPVVQADIARAVMEPVFALRPDAVIVTRGTEAHVGKSASHEEAIAKDWQRDGLPIIKHGQAFTWWHFVGDFCKVRVDASHHGSMGGRNWTAPNQANLHAADIFYEHIKAGRRHPDLCIRSHSHRSGDSYDAHPVRYMATPAMQLKTAYGHKKFAGKFADIGGIIAQCGEHLEARRVLYHPDPSPVWRAT